MRSQSLREERSFSNSSKEQATRNVGGEEAALDYFLLGCYHLM